MALLIGCGGSSDDDPYSISGTIAGLSTSGLVLANGSEAVSVPAGANGFAFESRFTGAYRIRVTAQPSGQTCSLSNRQGAGGTDVANVAVQCRDYVLYASAADAATAWQYSVSAGSGTLTALPGASSIATIAPLASAAAASVDRRVYFGHRDERRLSAYQVGDLGALSLVNSTLVPSESRGLAIATDSTTLMATHYTDASVSAYAIAQDGGLTARTSGVVAAGRTPTSVVTSPDGAHLYVLNTGSASISQFAVGVDGVPRPLAAASTSVSGFGQDPVALTISQDGQRVWVLFADTARLVQLARRADGTLAPASPSTANTGSDPRAIVQAGTSGRCVFVTNRANASISGYQLAAGTLAAAGALNLPAGSNPTAVAATPDGDLIIVALTGSRSIGVYRPDGSCGLAALGSITLATVPGLLFVH
jgi:6-phosphogluconolactonase (cycloisomerase 2 family)